MQNKIVHPQLTHRNCFQKAEFPFRVNGATYFFPFNCNHLAHLLKRYNGSKEFNGLSFSKDFRKTEIEEKYI